MLKRIGKGWLKVKRQQKRSTRSEYERADENCRFRGICGKRDALFRRLVVLDADLIGDTGMTVPEAVAFSVTDYLS